MILVACTCSLKRDLRWLLFSWPLLIPSLIMWTWSPHWKRYNLCWLLLFIIHFHVHLCVFILTESVRWSRIRSSSWSTQFSARSRGTPCLKPSVSPALLLLSPATASTCPSSSALRARPLCLTASQPFRCRQMLMLFLHQSCKYAGIILPWRSLSGFHSCLLRMSCLNPWLQPACWWNLLTLSLPRALSSAKHLSPWMSTCSSRMHLSRHSSDVITRVLPQHSYCRYTAVCCFSSLPKCHLCCTPLCKCSSFISLFKKRWPDADILKLRLWPCFLPNLFNDNCKCTRISYWFITEKHFVDI